MARASRGRRVIDPFTGYLRERVEAYPGLTGSRLLRELKERGYAGGYTAVTDFLRDVRPAADPALRGPLRDRRPASRRRSTSPSSRWCSPTSRRRRGSSGCSRMVLGYSRLIWARFVVHQDLQTVLRCHVAAFAAMGGAPREMLYDRMKTAVIGEATPAASSTTGRWSISPATTASIPRACRPYRAKTKGKVERPFRYIREDFFLARTFRNLDDLNAQLRRLARRRRQSAGARHHPAGSSTRPSPRSSRTAAAAAGAVPRGADVERRVCREGMVSVGGNFYSVPDTTRQRVLEVHTLADESASSRTAR